VVSHYVNDSTSAEYLRAALEWETDGERTPVQTDPSPEAMDIYTPALLRRQAA
jgi:hypothetical protein